MELVFSLIAGLIVAFAFQLLLANLGIALGLTVLDFSPKQGYSSDSVDISLPITHLLGIGVALTLSTVLFAAGLLTTEFSEIAEPRRGLIFGIILWATYWLLFVWLSSTTLSTLADSLFGAAFSNGRRLISTICQRVGSKNSKSEEQTTLDNLADEVSELAKEQQLLPQRLAEQRELLLTEINRMTSSPAPVENHIESSVVELEPTPVRPSPSLMSQLNLPNGRQLLQRVTDTIDIPDISDIDVHTLWRYLRSDNTADAVRMDIEDYLHQTPVWMFQPDILKEVFYERIYDPDAAPELVKLQLANIDRTHLVDWLQERGDLAADQIETIADQLTNVKDRVLAALPSSQSADLEKVKDKLIAYCRYTNLDLLTPDALIEKTRSQLDNHGISGSFRLDLEEIEAVLARRQGLALADQRALMDALRSVLPRRSAPRRWAVRSGQSAKNMAEHLATQVTHYLRHQDKTALNPAQMVRDLTQLAKTSAGSVSHHLPDSLPDSLFDRTEWRQALEKRRDLTAEEIQQVLSGTESVWQQTLQQVNAWVDSSWTDVKDTLRSKNDALLDTASQHLGKGFSAAQKTLETQVNAVKEDLQTQADAARGQVAIASWWLFTSLLLSGVSAATSGWLAVIY